MRPPNWISKDAESLAWRVLARTDDAPDFDVVIVGSGYGGAISAFRLAGATAAAAASTPSSSSDPGQRRTIELAVLERGFEYVPGTFPERFADVPGHIRINTKGAAPGARNTHGLFDLRVGQVSALVGNGLGGGSLINAGVMAEPAPEVFQNGHWPRAFDAAAVAKRFNAIKDALGAEPMPSASLPLKYRALERLASGYDDSRGTQKVAPACVAVSFRSATTFAGVEQKPCLSCGNCISGCNFQAKNTLATNYLPAAYRRGAQIFTGVTVQRLSRNTDGTWNLHWGFTEAQMAERYSKLSRSQKTPGPAHPPVIRARHVILSAGTYGSTEILLRSRAPVSEPSGAAPLNISSRIGKRFSTNGEMIAVAYATDYPAKASPLETDVPSSREVGPTIVGMIDRRDGKHGYVVQDLAIPTPLRRMFEEICTSTYLLHALGKWDCGRHEEAAGQDPAAIDPDRIRHTPVFGIIGHDDARGELRMRNPCSESLDGELTADWSTKKLCPPALDPYFLEPYRALHAAHAKSGAGGTVIPSPLWRMLPDELDGLLDSDSKGALITTHPLGGCPMGDHAALGVVNLHGQVFEGHAGSTPYGTLAVLDGSIIPCSLGINPSLTIAAIAHEAVDALASEWQLQLLDESELPLALPALAPLQPLNSWTHGKAATGARYAEVLKGDLTFRGVSDQVAATLELQFTPIEDLERFTRELPKELVVERGRLWLRDPRHPAEAIGWAVTGTLDLLPRKPSSAHARVWRAAVAWWRNRGRRELSEALCGRSGRTSKARRKGFLSRALMLAKTLSNAGEQRLFVYDLVVGPPDEGNESSLLAQCDRIAGRKLIAYEHRSNPWTQANRLSVEIFRDERRNADGVLLVDPIFGVRDHAVQFQITQQEDQPSALADLASFALYLARVVLKIHFFTFRAPHYRDDEARQDANRAIRDHVALHADQLDRFDPVDETRLPARIAGTDFSVESHRLKPRGNPDWTDPSDASDPVDLCKSPAHFRLTRYRRDGAQPVLLVHGFGASGNTFTTDTAPNLAQHLLDAKYDVWVLDLPTSIGMASSHVEWAFERASFAIDEALDRICSECGGRKVDVVAHCIGVAMFLMSVLRAGSDSSSRVRAAVLTQAGPVVRIPPLNALRGYIAGYAKAFLESAWKSELDITAERTPAESLIDRLLVAYPYEGDEWDIYNPTSASAVLENEAYFHRANAIWGKLFEVTHLNSATRDKLGDLIGHVTARAMQQTVLFMHMRRVCDVYGENAFVTTQRIAESLKFPLCLIHGTKNAVFEAQGAEDSFRLIARARGLQSMLQRLDSATDEGARRRIYEESNALRLQLKDGYGHQDLMLGANAHEDVFPDITRFFTEAAQAPVPAETQPVWIARFPRLGPVVGALRTRGSVARAKVLVISHDLESAPLAAAALVLVNGVLQPNLCVLALRQKMNLLAAAGTAKSSPASAAALSPQVLLPNGLRGVAPERTWALEIEVPCGADENIRIYCVTLHQEHADPRLEEPFPAADSRADPTRLALEPSFAFPVALAADSDLSDLKTAIAAVYAQTASAQQQRLVQDWADSVLAGCEQRVNCADEFAHDESTADLTYQWQMPYCVLTAGMLSAAHTQTSSSAGKLQFALASCRYAASIFDREAADAAFMRLRRRLEEARVHGGGPQFLILAGDQIYSDATAGLFDPSTGLERYDRCYLETWSAPHARAVLRAIPTYMMLDDHELEDNVEPLVQPYDLNVIAQGLQCYFLYQLRLSPNGLNLPLKFQYPLQCAGFPFFVLDTRIFRTRTLSSSPPRLEGKILADSHWQELKEWLRNQNDVAPAVPKFVVSAVPVFPWHPASRGHVLNSLRADAWDSFPHSLGQLLQFIAKHRIRNVVFLSGDYHCSLVARAELALIGEEQKTIVHSVVSSALYSPYPFANTNPSRLTRSYTGRLSEWYGATYPGPEDIQLSYEIIAETSHDGFATISLSNDAGRYALAVEFDTAKGAVPCSVVLD